MTNTTARPTSGMGRPIAPAVSGDSRPCGSVEELDKVFYGDGGQTNAWSVCRRCPVLTTCLREGLALDERLYAWGVFGGLTAEQRRALRVEEQLGNVPDLAIARILSRGQWGYRLRSMMQRGLTCEQMRAALERRFGARAATVTVRVAVWWLGGNASVLPKPGAADRRRVTQRLREDHAELLFQLQDMGLKQRDIAAYLEVRERQVQYCMQRLNREARAAESSDAAVAETVGLAA
ncbi:WhiB family transcriptional regulator [Streptomyces xanthochromogenes]|uniref:WhiB family transcriptional regulator n=1 Tax=Streptomyces xanthochromogenes TaxID=67384 RepID=UPI00341B33C0